MIVFTSHLYFSIVGKAVVSGFTDRDKNADTVTDSELVRFQ